LPLVPNQAEVVAPQEQEFSCPGVVGSLPLGSGEMFNKTREQNTIWRWENPCAFGDQVYRSNPQSSSEWTVNRTGEFVA
jgi:hypothetical protein